MNDESLLEGCCTYLYYLNANSLMIIVNGWMWVMYRKINFKYIKKVVQCVKFY